MLNTKEKESYALGYYYGRAWGSYGSVDFDQFTDREHYEFKQGYDRGVTDYCLNDVEVENA